MESKERTGIEMKSTGRSRTIALVGTGLILFVLGLVVGQSVMRGGGETAGHDQEASGEEAEAAGAPADDRAPRDDVTQAPLPGRRPARSGVTTPSGDSTKRIIPCCGRLSIVAMQRR